MTCCRLGRGRYNCPVYSEDSKATYQGAIAAVEAYGAAYASKACGRMSVKREPAAIECLEGAVARELQQSSLGRLRNHLHRLSVLS